MIRQWVAYVEMKNNSEMYFSVDDRNGWLLMWHGISVPGFVS